MTGQIATIGNFDQSVHSIEFQEQERKLSSYFFHVNQQPNENIGKIIDFHTIWNAARSKNILPSWNASLSDDLSDWHKVMRLNEIGSISKKGQKDAIHSDIFKPDSDPKTTLTLGKKLEDISAKNKNKYLEYLSYLHNHHYVISIGTMPYYDGEILPIILMSLPLAENGELVTHILSAVTALH